MLKMPTKTDIRNLKGSQSPSVSIYMSTDEDSKDSHTANRIRFKNLISTAQHKLTKHGLKNKAVKETLQHANALLDDTGFWNIRREGMAVFTNASSIRYFGIPKHIASEEVHVGDKYHVQPIEDIVTNNTMYFVLSLGHKDVQLLAGDKYHVEDVTPDVLPSDMKTALRIDEQPSELQNHEVSAVRGNRSNRSFHGQYNVKEEDKKDLVNFFRLIDNKVNGLMHREGNPQLILAGVEYLLPLYKQANTYVNLSKKHIGKNIQNMKEKDLLEIVQPLVQKPATSS